MTQNEKFGVLCPALRKQVTDKVFCPIETPMSVRKTSLGLTEELQSYHQGEGTCVTDETHTAFQTKALSFQGKFKPLSFNRYVLNYEMRAFSSPAFLTSFSDPFQ